jgi:hypothetical protein
MPQMTAKRVNLIILAVLLVFAGYRFVASIPVGQVWRSITSPSASSLAKRLSDPDLEVRLKALGQVDYNNRHDDGVIAALADIAKDKVNPRMHATAINNLAAEQGSYSNPTQDKQRLPQQTIDEVAALVLQEQDNNVLNALCNFLANTARWQSDAQQNLMRLTELLGATDDKYTVTTLLQAMKGYASYHEFPAATWDAVLKIYQIEEMQWGHPARTASEVFYQAAYYQRFPDHVRAAIEQALREHHNRDIRRNAMFTLGNQSNFIGVLSPALNDALDDTDAGIRRSASSVIALFNERQGEQAGGGLDALLATARDTSQRASVRVTALAEALSPKPGAGPLSEKALVVAEEFLVDPDPEIRAGGVIQLNKMSHHAAYEQRLPQVEAWLQRGLADEQAMVRRAAVPQLGYARIDDQQRHDYLVTALNDPDGQVVLAALGVVGRQKMDSPEIEAVLHKLASRDEPSQANTASAQLRRIELQRKSSMERFTDTLKDKRSWGGLLFMAVSALGIALAAVYAIYFAYRLLDFATQKSWRALASFGVLIVWSATTYGMVMMFVFGAFGMGHNAPAPLKDQLMIDAVLFGALLVYSGAGWLLHYLVRAPRAAKE